MWVPQDTYYKYGLFYEFSLSMIKKICCKRYDDQMKRYDDQTINDQLKFFVLEKQY